MSTKRTRHSQMGYDFIPVKLHDRALDRLVRAVGDNLAEAAGSGGGAVDVERIALRRLRVAGLRFSESR